MKESVGYTHVCLFLTTKLMVLYQNDNIQPLIFNIESTLKSD